MLALLLVLAALAPGRSEAQEARWHSTTLLGARRDAAGQLMAPVQQYLLAEAGGARESLSLRLDLRLDGDAASPQEHRGLDIYQLQLRHGRPGGAYELVAGRQVLLTGTGALLADAARVTLHPGQWLELTAAAGLERHPELDTPLVGPHVVLLGGRITALPRTTLQLAYLLRDERDRRREDRVSLTARHWLPLPLHPELDLATEADVAVGRLNLAEAALLLHPTPATALTLQASRTEPQPWGPVLGDGIWEIFLSGPSWSARAQAAHSGLEGSVAGSCAQYFLEPATAEASTATGRLCRLAYLAPRPWPLRPAASAFYLGGEVGEAWGGGLSLSSETRSGLQGVLRGDGARYSHSSGAAGAALWLRASVGQALSEHLLLQLLGEWGENVGLPEELRALAVLTYHIRGVRP